MGVGVIASTIRKLEVLAASQWVGHFQSHGFDQRVDLGDELLARLGVGAPLQTPVTVALRTVRLRAAEHVQAGRVPEVDRLLNAVLRITPSGRHLGGARGAKVDVASFLVHYA